MCILLKMEKSQTKSHDCYKNLFKSQPSIKIQNDQQILPMSFFLSENLLFLFSSFWRLFQPHCPGSPVLWSVCKIKEKKENMTELKK